MKPVVMAAIGFALGMACAHFRHGWVHVPWPSLPALPTVVQSALGSAVGSATPAPSSTLRDAIEPVERVVFGPLNRGKAFAVALEETVELEKLSSQFQADAAGQAARRVVGEVVLITGIADAVDNAAVRVLVHPAGTFQYSTTGGEKKTVRKLRFFRDIVK